LLKGAQNDFNVNLLDRFANRAVSHLVVLKRTDPSEKKLN